MRDTTDKPAPDGSTRVALGCGAAFLGSFMLVGLLVAVAALTSHSPNPGVALVVGLVFVAVPGGGLFLIRYAWREAGRSARRRAMAPDQPWMWKRDVSPSGEVKGTSPVASVAVISIFAGMWLGMMAIMTVVGWEKVRTDGALQAFFALFWAAGLFLGGLAVHTILGAARYGASTLKLDATPARLGQWASGVISAPRSVLGAEAQVDVLCEETIRTTRSAGSTSSSTSTLVRWRTTKVLDGARFGLRGERAEIPFAVLLPTNEQVDAGDLTGQRMDWYVSVVARVPGVDYSDRFAIPVAPAEPGVAAPEYPPREMPELTSDQLAERLPGRVERDHRGEALVFPLKISWLLWILIFAAVAVSPFLLPFLDIPQLERLPPELFRWGAIAGAVLFALSLLGLMLDTRRIEVTPEAVRIRRGVAGVGFHKTVPRRDVAGVEETTSRSNPPTYSVDIRLRDGKTCSAALALREADQAAALADRLRRTLGIEPAGR